MNSTSPKLQSVAKILQEKGATDEQIAQVLTEITKMAFTRLYNEAMDAFSEEDMKAIDACTSQEEASFEIMTRFAKATGKDAQETVRGYLDEFADKFLEDYKKGQNQPPSS